MTKDQFQDKEGMVKITPVNFFELYQEEFAARNRVLTSPDILFATKLLILGTTFSEMVACMYQGDDWVGARGGLRWSTQCGWE